MTDTPIVWQRVPQGWIELVAFVDDETAEKWWEVYLGPLGETLEPGVRDTLTHAFHATRLAVRDTPYAVAGILPYLVDEPTVFFVGTSVLPAPPEPRGSQIMSGFAGLVRFGDDMRTEPFIALDGRNGSATLGCAQLDSGAEVAAITGTVPLADGSGHVFVLALSLDPERLDELVPYAALALDSTMLLAADQAPPPYPFAEATA